ncbi:chemotaxis protein CheW [Desulfococcaceae bacterium HSG9]|nr:chemotaxis protein CheW [Desulfococcaceae bacterium HSG9]
MPISAAARLEELSLKNVENIGGQDVVQYREDILPLIHLADFMDDKSFQVSASRADTDKIQVIVYSKNGVKAGLVVENIIDIVDEIITVKGFSKRDSFLFSTVVKEHVVEIIDVERIIANALPGLLKLQIEN